MSLRAYRLYDAATQCDDPVVLYSAAYAIAWSPLITSYTLEILPFNLRAKGYTLFSFAVSASLVFNQYINPLALAGIGWKYYVSSHRMLQVLT